MKKGLTILLCIAMAGMILTGCSMRSASGTTATAAPIVTNSPMATSTSRVEMNTIAPQSDMNADTEPGVMNGGMAGSAGGGTSGTTDTMDNGMMNRNGGAASMTPAEAGRLAEKIAEAVERISEVDDAEVVVGDNSRVLVAVEFDDQYGAGLDERMKKMIVEAVQKEDDSLMDIEITDDDTLYGQVKGLGERLAKATGLDELADDFGDLWDRITGM